MIPDWIFTFSRVCVFAAHLSPSLKGSRFLRAVVSHSGSLIHPLVGMNCYFSAKSFSDLATGGQCWVSSEREIDRD